MRTQVPSFSAGHLPLWPALVYPSSMLVTISLPVVCDYLCSWASVSAGPWGKGFIETSLWMGFPKPEGLLNFLTLVLAQNILLQTPWLPLWVGSQRMKEEVQWKEEFNPESLARVSGRMLVTPGRDMEDLGEVALPKRCKGCGYGGSEPQTPEKR